MSQKKQNVYQKQHLIHRNALFFQHLTNVSITVFLWFLSFIEPASEKSFMVDFSVTKHKNNFGHSYLWKSG